MAPMSPLVLDLTHLGLQVTAGREPPVLHVQISGELDFACAHRLSAVSQVEVDGIRVVKVDLTRLSFVDTAGTAALLALRQRNLSAGREVHLMHPQRLVRRVFTVLGHDHCLAA
jgi:anti-anti-sigma factor